MFLIAPLHIPQEHKGATIAIEMETIWNYGEISHKPKGSKGTAPRSRSFTAVLHFSNLIRKHASVQTEPHISFEIG
jgi:hypothetical protein